MRKKIIAVDFDGVLYSFIGGWISPRDISDPPVTGAINWLRHLINIRYHSEGHFQVVIFSARVYYWGGKRAIKRWLHKWGLTKEEIATLKFVHRKPVCGFLLDDRVVCFRGKFPTDQEIMDFKPWHGQGIFGGKDE